MGFLSGSVVKNPLVNEGNGNPVQYSCLGNPTDKGAWRATVYGVSKESYTVELLNNNKRWVVCCSTSYNTLARPTAKNDLIQTANIIEVKKPHCKIA